MARQVTYDQEKVKELRGCLIEDSLIVFSGEEKDTEKVKKWSQFRKDLLMKYAPRVLPTLNEVTGRDGGAIQIEGVEISVRK